MTLYQRFWSHVDKTGECWNFTTYRMPNGYHRISLGGRNSYDYAHRVSWRLHAGEIPDGMLVLHKCDNRSCIRKKHLFLGTYKDNMLDMMAKGRCRSGPRDSARKGEECHLSKLDAERVKRIRGLYDQGVSRFVIADEFGITASNVFYIGKRKTWRSIEDRKVVM